MSARNFVKVRGELVDSRKVFTACKFLGANRNEVLGLLVRWLLWVDAHCECADTGLRAEDVNDVVGDEYGFDALCQIGWVERVEDGTVRVCEFEKYLSPSAKQRQATAARVSAFRERRRAAAAAAGELPAGLKRPRKAGKAGARLRKSGQAASATPRRVASRLREATPRQAETTSTRKGGKR